MHHPRPNSSTCHNNLTGWKHREFLFCIHKLVQKHSTRQALHSNSSEINLPRYIHSNPPRASPSSASPPSAAESAAREVRKLKWRWATDHCTRRFNSGRRTATAWPYKACDATHAKAQSQLLVVKLCRVWRRWVRRRHQNWLNVASPRPLA